MRHLCSDQHCTRTATRVLIFDAAGVPDDGKIRIRAHAFACDEHRRELKAAVGAFNEANAAVLD